MRRVIMPIGLPGSGKSSLTTALIAKATKDGQSTAVCSTDDFFMNNGMYEFNPGKLRENHALNFQKFAMELIAGTEFIVVDNTNLIAAHREPYIVFAEALGYRVEMPVVGEFHDEACIQYASRNLHGVPLESIRRMASAVQFPSKQEML